MIKNAFQTKESRLSYNIILGCTGSVASIKVPILAERFTLSGHNVQIVPTQTAFHFLKAEAIANCRTYPQVNECCRHLNLKTFEKSDSISSTQNARNQTFGLCLECETKKLYPEFMFVTDTEEWEQWNKRGDPIRHIELRNWADILLLAPLDANTLAKTAQGLCDNLLTCIIRAWNMNKPLLFCPAMNTQMYMHPFTSQHIEVLKSLGYQEIEATSKTLMCGETGIGAMASVDVIVDAVEESLRKLATW